MKRLGTSIAVGMALVAPMASVADESVAPLIAQSCAGCHGQNGEGQGPIVAIAGTDREAFLTTWAAFRADERQATIMNRIARGYTDEEVAALADYFASLR